MPETTMQLLSSVPLDRSRPYIELFVWLSPFDDLLDRALY